MKVFEIQILGFVTGYSSFIFYECKCQSSYNMDLNSGLPTGQGTWKLPLIKFTLCQSTEFL